MFPTSIRWFVTHALNSVLLKSAPPLSFFFPERSKEVDAEVDTGEGLIRLKRRISLKRTRVSQAGVVRLNAPAYASTNRLSRSRHQ
jgi:hypothetical protein